jgi:hypothetical protein
MYGSRLLIPPQKNPPSAENKQFNSYSTVNTSTPNPSRHKKGRKMQQKDIIEKPSIKPGYQFVRAPLQASFWGHPTAI